VREREGDLYLLQATWQERNHEYRHRLIHTRAKSVEEMFEILANEHPEWGATDDYTTVGEIYGRHTSVTVFKTVSMDSDSWRPWVGKRRMQRREEIEEEERDRDLAEIGRLTKKWGVSAREVLALAAQE